MSVPRNQILTGNAVEVLARLPDASIDCVITSPPYFRLRDYQMPGQLGLEDNIDSWVDHLVAVCDEIARVLVPTGTVWLNLGDTYSVHSRQGANRKSLLLGPERLALRLVDKGWIVRNKIIWAKTNTTPTSVRDRLATRHEVIYLLSRRPRYYFDLDLIREPHTSKRPTPRKTRPPKRRDASRPRWLGPNSDGDSGLTAMHAAGITGHPLGKNPGDIWRTSVSSYRGAHFATYPPQLVDRMLLAGCPKQRCRTCRAPWISRLTRRAQRAERQPAGPSCSCASDSEPGLVLDPFLGSGTTAVVARQHHRDFLGIELNPQYVRLAKDRLEAPKTTTKRKEVT